MKRKMPAMNVTVTQDILDMIDRERDIQWLRGQKMSRSEVVRYVMGKGLSALEQGGRDRLLQQEAIATGNPTARLSDQPCG